MVQQPGFWTTICRVCAQGVSGNCCESEVFPATNTDYARGFEF